MVKGTKNNSRSKSSFFWISSFVVILFIITAILCLFAFSRRQGGSVIARKEANANEKQDSITHTATQGASTATSEDATNPSSESTTEAIDYTLETDTPVVLLRCGESYSPKVDVTPQKGLTNLSWESNDTSIASVDSSGKITAKKDGRAVVACQIGKEKLSIYVNIVTEFPTEQRSTLTLYNQDGKELKYRLYHQSAHDYSNYNSYLAWHGCATCSFTTVLNAFSDTYKDYDPAKVINTIEKEVASPAAWERHHVKREMKRQMPPSMSGIYSMLKYANIKADYVRTFTKKEAKEQILSHLRTGNPVIFEVRKKSNITGEQKERWTASVHTMVYLGTYTKTGEVLICDSVNRRWYSGNGGQRVKVVNIDDPMEYMYPCTTFETSTYYTKQSADGGYILIN